MVPGVVITQPAPTPTIDPIAAPTATAFQSAMPTTVGTYALVEATPLDPADIALTAGRVADGVDLVYRSGDDTMKVRALQYYSEDDAKAMFTKFVGEGADHAARRGGRNHGWRKCDRHVTQAGDGVAQRHQPVHSHRPAAAGAPTSTHSSACSLSA